MKELHKYMYKYHLLTREDRRWIYKHFRECEICNGKVKRKMLVIDHCHASGICRGRLCNRCNSWLGIFEGNQSTEKKEKLYSRVEGRHGIHRSKFKSYLKKTQYLKDMTPYSDERADFEPVLVVEL